jgi:hypothetical protein
MQKSVIIFNIEDYRGIEVEFTKKKWNEKRIDHPELNKEKFIKCVKRALNNPDEVWEDYSDRKRKNCYYKKYSVNSYAKVVVWIKDKPNQVVTAYEIDKVKEKNYPDLKQLV